MTSRAGLAPSFSPLPSPRSFVLLAGLAAIALGASVLAGWALDIAALKSVVPGTATMKPNTAVGMLLCGIALTLISRGRPQSVRLPVVAIGLAVIALGCLTMAQDLSGLDFGIDRWLFADAVRAAEPARPGRMSPSAAFCYLLLGSGLLVAARPVLTRLAAAVVLALGTAVVFIGALGLGGYVSALASGSRWWNYAGMAVHTTAGLIVLGCGLLAFAHACHPLKWSLNRLVTIGFALGVVSMSAATIVTYRSAAELQAAEASVTQAQEVLKEIEEVESRLASLESSQRGYIITGDERLLVQRPAITAALHEHLAAARALTAANPARQRGLDEVEALTKRRIEFGEHTIRVRRESGFTAARQLVATGTGIGLTASIGKMLEEFEQEQYALLEQRHRQSGAATSATFLLMPLGVFLSVTILLVGLFLLNSGAAQQRRTEEAMRASEAKYRQLVDQASDGIFVLEPTGHFSFLNPRACELLGYRQDELLGRENAITYPEGERHVVAGRMLEARHGAVLRYERMVLRKDGTAFPAEFSSRMLDTGSFQVIFHDITERRRAEATLRESEEKFREIIEQASDGIFITDAQGNFLLANSRGCELLGYTEDELLKLNGRETYREEEREVYARRLLDLRPGVALRYERMVRRKDGTLFPADSSVKKLENGQIQVMFHDITERKRTQDDLMTERTLLRTLVDALPDFIFTKDASGRFTMANKAAYENSGFADESKMLGKTVFDFYPHEMAAPFHADDMQTLAGESVLNREEVSMHAADGLRRWFLTIKVPLRDATGKATGLVGVSRDITERKEHEDRIARLNRIQAVLSGINSAIVRIRDRAELFSEACRIAAMHGAFKIAWIGMRDASGAVQPQVWAGDGAEFFEAMMRDPRGAQMNPRGAATLAIDEQRTIVDNDIRSNPSLDTIRSAAVDRGCNSVIGLPLYSEGKVTGVLVMYAAEKEAFDAEEIKLLEEMAGDISFALTFIAQKEKVDYLAYYDTLTGLPNRSLFFDRLEQQLGRANREHVGVALVLIDIDRFRMFNDTLGRQAGDELLKAIAERVKGSVRAQDTVARLSANTFAMALSGSWRAERLARFIEAGNRELFSRPYWIGGEELRVSATAGIAVFPDDAALPEALVANAEAALRNAKRKNIPLLFYGPEMNAQAAESLRMENRLRRALERQELVLWYQPKFSVTTGKLTGFEALMRWNDPELGMIPPAKFIPLMEQTGLILAAGNWALSQVARDCAGWTDGAATPPRIAVNVSPLQLREKDFVTRVVDAVDGIEKSGGLLDLEITESVIMENVDAIIPKLQTLRGLGVRIYIDDFGTGYSSLAYIARLPIYSLKIDRSFVVGMTQNADSLSIVNSVISLAHSLKLTVVAEGVETEEQARLLKELSCDEYQGYLFGKPVPANEVPGVMGRLG